MIDGAPSGLARFTQFVSRSGERRALRAKVREELSTVEQRAWCHSVIRRLGGCR
jgi:hypothetical protein